VKNGLLQLSLT